ncbi:MAG: BMP family ABC transporter substrate-binding protein, partial [Clostridia bacterium]
KGDGGNGNDTQKVPKTSITADQINVSPEQIAKVKIGAIYITSQSDTSGYTYAHNNGIRIAMKDLGIPENAIAIQDNVPEDATAVGTAIDTLVGQGCNMIIGISFGYIDAMAAGATEYPGVVFSHATGFKSTDTNFNNYFGRIYQARYLSGIAAGLKSLEVGNNTLGFVAAYGTEYAETCSGINAFALGVQSVNPTAEILVKTLNTWGNETLERSAAESLIDASGCEIIAQHCDSAQPQLVAAEKGKFGCGYNSDMTKQAPTGHLT